MLIGDFLKLSTFGNDMEVRKKVSGVSRFAFAERKMHGMRVIGCIF